MSTSILFHRLATWVFILCLGFYGEMLYSLPGVRGLINPSPQVPLGAH